MGPGLARRGVASSASPTGPASRRHRRLSGDVLIRRPFHAKAGAGVSSTRLRSYTAPARRCIWSGSATISVVVVAGIYPSVAIPDRVAVIVRVTESANEDLAAVEPVSHHMPVDVGAVPGTRHRSESDGTRMNGAESPPGVSARKSAGKSAVASTETTATVTAAPSSKYGTRSQDQ